MHIMIPKGIHVVYIVLLWNEASVVSHELFRGHAFIVYVLCVKCERSAQSQNRSQFRGCSWPFSSTCTGLSITIARVDSQKHVFTLQHRDMGMYASKTIPFVTAMQ